MASAWLADPLLDGRHALEAARWQDARAAFEDALAARETPDARDGLGQALWFLGLVEEGIAARERAFEEYVRDRRGDDAARVGVWVSHQHYIAGRASAARGWLARAERALEDAGTCEGHGWVAVERARHAGSVEQRADHARRALRIARDTDAGDLEVFALSLLGRAEVSAGRRDAGMQLLEEAMAAAAAGRVRTVHTLGEAYCNLIMASTDAGELERAAEWCELVDGFALEHGVTPLLGACRTVHADILLATGRWHEAERALTSALEAHARHVPAMGAPTVAAMAELRVRQGRLPEAEQLLAGREVHPSSLRALAQLRIAEGRPQVAAALLERGLTAAGDDAMRVSQLLAPLVDARLACDDVVGAEAAAGALEALAGSSQIGLVAARADLAAARVALAGGHPAEAADRAARALAVFGRLAMPLDVGEARLELARARARRTGARARRGEGRVRVLPGARRLARDGRRGSRAARPRRRHGATRPLLRRAHRARAGGARAARARDVERADRADAGHQREDGRPSRQPHPLQARRPQPRRGGRSRRARHHRLTRRMGSR